MGMAIVLKGGLAEETGAVHIFSLVCTILPCLVGFLLPDCGLVLTPQMGSRSLSFERLFGG